MASLGAPLGRTCACTPRSLLVPAGGVITLHPSQRVSAKELEAKDREWQRRQERQPASQRLLSDHALRRQASYPPSYVSSASRDVGAADIPSHAKKPKKKVYSLSVFGRKRGKQAPASDR